MLYQVLNIQTIPVLSESIVVRKKNKKSLTVTSLKSPSLIK